LRVAADRHPAVVEYLYSRHSYATFTRAFAATTARVGLSVAEALAAGLLLAVLVWLGSALVRLVAGGTTFKGFLAGLVQLATFAGQLALLFEVLWGLNYSRRTVADLLALDTSAIRPEELDLTAGALLAEAAALREGLPEGEDGALRLVDGVEGALARVPAAFHPGALAPVPLPAAPLPPKAPRTSPLLSYLGVGGIFVPFTGEAQVNETLPDWEIPFTACHEVAHQMGFAREDDASFVGYRACREHPDADFRYSATFRAGLSVLGALARADPEAYGRRRKDLPPPLQRDLAALAAWRRRYASRLAGLHDRVNDAFLKSQGQKEGVQSYGRVVDLLVAERRAAARPAAR
jgi:hypothetical protein